MVESPCPPAKMGSIFVDGAPSTCFSAEDWNLLLACTSFGQRDAERLTSVLRKTVSWENVIQLAGQHGLASLLYQNLAPFQQSIPPPVFNLLREKYERNIQKTMFLARELIRVLDCLNPLGINLIPYKGIVLSEIYYGDMALRQSGDLDIFVRRDDVVRSKSALQDLGYTSRFSIPENAEGDYLASGYECSFDSQAGKNLLELQWALQPHFYAVDYNMEGLFQRAVTATVAGHPVKTLSPEDHLLVLSIHAAKHVWGRLIWLYDIAQIVRGKNLNWSWIGSQARDLGIERMLHITLLLAKRLLAVEIPSIMASAVEADHKAAAMVEQIAASIAAGVVYEEEKMSYFRLMMSLRERRWDRLRFASRLVFTPGPGEWEAVRLPRTFFPLYRVVRLLRLVARFAR